MSDHTIQPIVHSLVTALRAVPDFADLDDEALLALVGASANLVWSTGSVIFETDEPAAALYVVLSGAVDIIDDSGESIRRAGPGEYIGERALLLDATHSKAARAVSDSELMVVPKQSFQPLLDTHPELAVGVRRRLDRRLRGGQDPQEP